MSQLPDETLSALPAVDRPAAASCPTRGGKKRNAVLAALMCAHCSLTLGAAALSVTLAAAPTVFGVSLEWIAPPFLILGAFGWWLWSGRSQPSKSEAREITVNPPKPVQDS